MSVKLEAICGNCRWWNLGYGAIQHTIEHELPYVFGTCHRHAPLVPPPGMDRWPQTVHEESCGDFETMQTELPTDR